jgi:hypothetical protein
MNLETFFNLDRYERARWLSRTQYELVRYWEDGTVATNLCTITAERPDGFDLLIQMTIPNGLPGVQFLYGAKLPDSLMALRPAS